ncbi:MAG: universal stress protein [Solirubrobacterales bacterium]
MRLLVGLDHRQGGRDALELARVLGSTEPSSALVVTVLYTGPYPMEFALLPEEEAEEAEPLFEQARTKLAGIEVETRAYGGGSPAGIIDSVLHRDHFDAVVVGSPHRGAVGRVLIGSVAASLLSGAPTAVAVAPVGYSDQAHPPPRTVAVGFDGTPESDLALRRAEQIARHSGAALDLITVVRPPRAVPAMVPTFSPQFPPNPDEVINSGVSSVAEGISAAGSRLDGDPASELIRCCEDGVDLLVLGSRGYGPFSRALLGSVSRQVAEHAACPVLVVPRP